MKKLLTILFIGSIFIALVIGSTFASEEIITLNKQERKSAVEFAHNKHINDYGYDCSECHHDKNHNPFNNLTMDSDVQECIVCHNKLKGARDDILVYKNALHQNCIGCHKSYNENKTGNKRRGPAPTRCSDCHPR